QGTKAANPFADRDMYFQGVRGKIEQSSRLRCPILGWPVPSSDNETLAFSLQPPAINLLLLDLCVHLFNRHWPGQTGFL
ncbi:MAG: hypothetical protein ACLQVM_12095, partial [Terriglobia bacterium]